MDLKELGCEDVNLFHLSQVHIYWQALVLAMLYIEVLIPESLLHALRRKYEQQKWSFNN
jgi:hypothetical protein